MRSILDDLPHESVIYFGDHGHFPYGPRPLEEVRGFALVNRPTTWSSAA